MKESRRMKKGRLEKATGRPKKERHNVKEERKEVQNKEVQSKEGKNRKEGTPKHE